MKLQFFDKDPEISWQKISCPFCGEPTGPSSECHMIDDERKMTTHKTLGILPIFSLNCYFKNTNAWRADINYPVSGGLIKILSSIEGIDNVNPVGPYAFEIAIAKLFSEHDIKLEVNRSYRNFIKTMHVYELNKFNITKDKEFNYVKLPNGKTVDISELTESEILAIQEKIPESLLDSEDDSDIIDDSN